MLQFGAVEVDIANMKNICGNCPRKVRPCVFLKKARQRCPIPMLRQLAIDPPISQFSIVKTCERMRNSEITEDNAMPVSRIDK